MAVIRVDGSVGQAEDKVLDRAEHLALLERDLETVLMTKAGRIRLVCGEAGVGKTTLVRAFQGACGDQVRFLEGACDPLFTPRPLGPVLDVADQVAGRLRAVASEPSQPFEVAAELLRALAKKPAVLILEDLHWADEATLDVLRLVARRVESVTSLVVVTYRDDQLGSGDLLRTVVGELVRQQPVHRMRLDPLSLAAVQTLARPHGVDARALHELTGGNPFFVTEVLASGDERLPESVRAAVLARVAGLPATTRPLLEAVAIGSQPAEHWLLEELAPEATSALDTCVAHGILAVQSDLFAFRHELARRAVEDSVPPTRRRRLHAAALAALGGSADREADPARLAHHAQMAGDAEASLRFAPAAARRASALGAHREAAAHYALALVHAGGLPGGELAPLLSDAAHEHGLVGQLEQAASLWEQAAAAFRATGRPLAQGEALRALAWPLWTLGRTERARISADEAVGALDRLPPSPELARAYATRAFLHRTRGETSAALAWGERAVDLGESLGDSRAAVEGLTVVGSLEAECGNPAGAAKVKRALALATATGMVDAVASALASMAHAMVTVRARAAAEQYIAEGIEHCARYDLDGWRPYLVALRAERELELGRWENARDAADTVVRSRGAGPATVFALVTLARLRGRRGDPEPWEPADRALELAEGSDIGRLGRVAAARAELAWLEGRVDQAVAETDRAWELARGVDHPWIYGELALWRARAGAECETGAEVAAPYAAALAGDWRRADELWTTLGSSYEAALAAAEGNDADRHRALEVLHSLGARRTAAVVARRLRERGARGLPRGPRPTTATNPANLTARELEVLQLVAEGLRNADIAIRLFISPRTVDHHVSAILRKLDLGSRGEAAAAAARFGVSAR